MTRFAAVPDVVVVGSAARDVDHADPRGWRLGGTAPYVALGIARLGPRVGVLLGVDRLAAGAAELELLRAAGVDIHLLPLLEGPIFDNRETPAGRDQWCVAVGERFGPASFPGPWRGAPVLVLGPVAGELGSEWTTVPAGEQMVALALQGVVRHLVAGQRTGLLPLRRSSLTERADLLMVGRDDLAVSPIGDPLTGLLGAPGQRMVVSAAHRGGMFLERSANGRLYGRQYPAVPAAAVRDFTGAGDAFLAGWIVAECARRHARELGRPDRANPAEDRGSMNRAQILRFAATVAALKMEGYGLDGMPTLSTVAARTGRVARVGRVARLD